MYKIKMINSPISMLTEESLPIMGFVVSYNGKYIGLLEINGVKYDPKVYIRDLEVVKEERGKGHGKGIFLLVKQLCLEQNLHKIELEYTDQSKSFWEHLGFKKVKGKKNMFITF